MLERLERWSARATLIILAGIVGEIGALWYFDHSLEDRISGTLADAAIAIGLVVEYFVILRAIVATGDANRESEENVAEANARAGEANARAEEARARTAEVEKLTAWRRITPIQLELFLDALSPIANTISLWLEFQSSDIEALHTRRISERPSKKRELRTSGGQAIHSCRLQLLD